MKKKFKVGERIRTEVVRFSSKIVKGKRVITRVPIKVVGTIKKIEDQNNYGKVNYTITDGTLVDFVTRIVKKL